MQIIGEVACGPAGAGASGKQRDRSKEIEGRRGRRPMSKRNVQVLIICAICVICGLFLRLPAARAQVATGTPPFGSFSGGPDIVNNGNLNVHLSIPVENKAGRGLPFNYNLTYDTSVWYPVTSGSTTTWQPVTNWGWRPPTAAQSGYLYYNQQSYYCTFWTGYNWQTAPYEQVFNGFIYYDSGGTAHPFLGENDYWSNPGYGCPSGTNSYDNNSKATDNSGYILNGQNWSITPPSGGTFSPQYQAITGPGSTSDANGNMISNTDNGIDTVYTDTLGVTALTVSDGGGPSSPMTFQYPSAGGTGTVKMNFTAETVQTAFGCGSIAEFGPTSENLVSEIDLPDDNPSGTRDRYLFTYERTPGNSANVTGRLYSVTLPSGGTIYYTYSGGANGITCNSGSSDGSTATLTRATPDGTWTYAHTENGTAWTTTLTDPNSNATTFYFQSVTPSGSTTAQAYETERLLPGGTETIYACYNGNLSYPCNGTSISLPITERTVWTTLGNQTSEVDTDFDSYGYGLPTWVNQYNWGLVLVRQTQTSYALGQNCGITNSSVLNLPCSITVKDGSNNVVSTTSFTYNANGNLLTETPSVGPQLQFTHNSNGTVATSYDGAGTTNYSYDSASCNAFPYSITPPAGPSTSLSWDCNGAVVLSANTGNGATTYGYDNMNRVTSVRDANGSTTTTTYTATTSESYLNFATNSTMDVLTTVDGLGRPIFSQRKQMQGATNFDSVQTTYDSLGRPYQSSPLYSALAQGVFGGIGWTATLYDAMSRPTSITDGDGGQLAFTYSYNDVLRTLNPAPSGEKPKSVQYEYDGLGRLTSVCEISGAAGSGACSQNTAATGFFTSYSYDALNDLTGVSQSGQPRTYVYDSLKRLTQETNPETGNTYYTYDNDGTCGSSGGDLVKRMDNIGNVTCYHYDAAHRLTSVTYPSGSYASVTPAKYFVYDSATVNGVGMSDAEGRLAEAYTVLNGTRQTDLGFSYDGDGNVTQVWESTPNSGGYYKVNAATYWPNSLPETLQLLNNGGGALIPQISYNPNGEGRVGSTSVSGGQNPVTGANYNVFGEPTSVSLGSGDSDSFGYDANTGRLTQYNYSVNGSTVTGNLGWNANGTMASLGISDPFNSANSQSCTYGYDELARVSSANCGGSIWNQSFSYSGGGQNTGAFGNLSKSGNGGAAESFNPNYSTSTNRVTYVGGVYPGYDANGNLTSDGVNTYGWDADGHMHAVGSTTVTYDALGRAVEVYNGGYTQMVYGPSGNKLALMSGQTLSKAFVPLAGGATAVYNSSGLAYYRHSDWQGSSRLASTASRGVYYDGAYAPYGENYAETGTQDRSFTGQNQDTVSSGSYPMYDFLMRKYHPTWGRWLSPDPAGLGAVDPTNPQSWNRYAYVLNNPTNLTDPTGLDPCYEYYCPPTPPCDSDGQPSCVQAYGMNGIMTQYTAAYAGGAPVGTSAANAPMALMMAAANQFVTN